MYGRIRAYTYMYMYMFHAHVSYIGDCLNSWLVCVLADEVHKVVAQGNKLIKTKVPPLRKSLAIYLANEETEHILFRPIRVSSTIHCVCKYMLYTCTYILYMYIYCMFYSLWLCCLQANVLQVYEALEKVVIHYYSTSDQFIISAPTQDQVHAHVHIHVHVWCCLIPVIIMGWYMYDIYTCIVLFSGLWERPQLQL